MNLTGRESLLASAYREQVLLLNSPMLRYVEFDFHKECKGVNVGTVFYLSESLDDIVFSSSDWLF